LQIAIHRAATNINKRFKNSIGTVFVKLITDLRLKVHAIAHSTDALKGNLIVVYVHASY
jgi:hypothetical protein